MWWIKSERDFPCDSSGKTEVYHLCVITDKCYGAVRYNARGDYASVFYSSTHATGGAVLIGYASSAAIIWQAAIVAGATTAQISGWMTALGLAMGVSTLTLTLWYRVPVLTAWSTPGAALLVTGLQGLTLNEAIGVFIVTNALIVLCGITGLFARLMRIIPHSLAAAMLAGILLRFGLQAFASLDGQFTLCGSMLLVWLATKAVAPRYAVIAA